MKVVYVVGIIIVVVIIYKLYFYLRYIKNDIAPYYVRVKFIDESYINLTLDISRSIKDDELKRIIKDRVNNNNENNLLYKIEYQGRFE